jgi:glycosyltransferase involved in cell wall biosynthesis
MKAEICVIRPFHSAQTANTLRAMGASVSIYTSAPRHFFRRLDPEIPIHLVPSPVDLFNRLSPVALWGGAALLNSRLWDAIVSRLLGSPDVVVGYATHALSIGRAAHRRGARFLLDRACPHVDFQQELMREESEKTGARFRPLPAWFRERQLAEYEAADRILVPSRYSARSFPEPLRGKTILAPLRGRIALQPLADPAPGRAFTVGVLGGDSLRKGFLYLLEAWRSLALPDAVLRIRTSENLAAFPRLAELLKSATNVEIVQFVPHIAEFYQSCDVFVLPSVDDGFGMALFEAMACGVPCVATRNCGASELLVDGVDGLLIDARSVDQLADAILRLYRSAELRRSLGHAGRETVARVGDSTQYADALAECLVGPLSPAAAAR